MHNLMTAAVSAIPQSNRSARQAAAVVPLAPPVPPARKGLSVQEDRRASKDLPVLRAWPVQPGPRVLLAQPGLPALKGQLVLPAL